MTTSDSTFSLYTHQDLGAEWLAATTRGGLFDEQGLGKTATCIVAADRVGARRVLVVAPVVVAHNWAREMRRWSPARKVQVITTGRTKVDASASVVIVTHALLLSAALRAQLFAVRWDVAIVDEAHAMKNPKAQRTKHTYTLGAQLNAPSVASCSARTWVLTGTPMPNNPSELWTHLRGLAPERIYLPGTQRPMNWWQFRDRYCVLAVTRFGEKIVGAKNVDELKERMRGFSLRRLKRDHLSLPPVLWGTVAITGDVTKELRELEASMKKGSDGAPDRDSVEFSTWRRLCGLAKAPAAAELLAGELDEGTHKEVVFAHHKEVIDTLHGSLAAFGPVTITGAQSAAERQAAVQRFQTDPACRVAICNLVAGGVGITLTASSRVTFVESSFVPGENAQAADRVHRIGQTAETVSVRVLSLAGSVDELVAEINARKASMIRAVLQ